MTIKRDDLRDDNRFGTCRHAKQAMSRVTMMFNFLTGKQSATTEAQPNVYVCLWPIDAGVPMPPFMRIPREVGEADCNKCAVFQPIETPPIPGVKS